MTRINGIGQHRAERRCAAMIKIRYRNANELPPGLHATAERHGRTITIYLLPGLAAEERNAALRRLRLSGRMGHGPRLPGVQLGFALFADRVRATIGQAGSVFRKHPAGTTGPVMLISAGAIAFLVLSAVSIRVLREPRGPDESPASGPAPAASAIAVRIPGSSRHLADDPGGSEGRVLTTALTGSDPLPLPNSPDLPGSGSGAAPDTGTGNTASSTTGAGGGGTPVGAGADSTPNPTASATAPGVPSATASVSPSAAAPPAPVPSSDPPSASIPAPAPSPVSASAAPSGSGLPSVSASVPVSVSASIPASVSASGPVTVSASVAPSVSLSVPASAYTSNPVAASASVTATVSASLPTSGSASSAGSSAPAQSPPVTASVTGGACLDVGPLGVCLDV